MNAFGCTSCQTSNNMTTGNWTAQNLYSQYLLLYEHHARLRQFSELERRISDLERKSREELEDREREASPRMITSLLWLGLDVLLLVYFISARVQGRNGWFPDTPVLRNDLANVLWIIYGVWRIVTQCRTYSRHRCATDRSLYWRV